MRSFVIIFLASAIVLFSTFGLHELTVGDETRTAGIALEMFLEGDYLVPRLNGEPFLEYPPMFCWVSSFFFRIFGISDTIAKLPSLIAAFLLVLVTYAYCKRLRFSDTQTLLSCLILVTCGYFLTESRKCRVDTLLTLFIFFGVYAFHSLREAVSLPRKLLWFLLYAASLSCAICTKGLFGLALPGIYILAMLLTDYLSRDHFSFFAFLRTDGKSYVQAAAGALLALLPASLWYILLYRNEGSMMFNEAFWVNNLGRFSGSQGDHLVPIWYYLKKLPGFFIPWLPLLLFSLWSTFRNGWRNGEKTPRLLALLLITPFIFLSLSASKRVVYLFSLYPFAAMLCGWHAPQVWENLRARFSCLRHTTLPPIFFCVLIAVLLLADAIRAHHSRQHDSLRLLFQVQCRQLEKDGWRLILSRPSERLQGASYFYLQKRLPEERDIRQPHPKEAHIRRISRDGYEIIKGPGE